MNAGYKGKVKCTIKKNTDHLDIHKNNLIVCKKCCDLPIKF